ncbi:MAG: sigma-54 dependent transcriptional regulator [candidate division KSB1 bacterium]|nr:sigma-54 dependent transcriptional regulator [candidate division KSB1 bacterium]
MKVLLVEDEKVSRIALRDALQNAGYQVVACEKGHEGLEWIEEDHFQAVITDLRLPDMTGLEILRAAKEKHKDCAVIVVTAYGTVETAVEALKLGAYDYVTKPFSTDKLLTMLRNIRQFHELLHENIQLKRWVESYQEREIIGNSAPMRRVLEILESVAATDYTVLIQGESGTGKELAARFLHRCSERRQGPFIAVNCAALPESLLESELFGYEKGAFTGALRRHLGYIERSRSGTLFIDDVDDLPLRLQVKLLRVLQEREVQRLGGDHPVPVDFRLVCASKTDLRGLVEAGSFREDLFYRLNVITVTMPPLRDHREDIPLLIDHFAKKYGQGKRELTLAPAQLKQLMTHDWPGNVRELENVVQRMLALPVGVDFLELAHTTPAEPPAESSISQLEGPQEFPSLKEFLREQENQLISKALRLSDNNISRAARLLKIPRTTLQCKIGRVRKAMNPSAEHYWGRTILQVGHSRRTHGKPRA